MDASTSDTGQYRGRNISDRDSKTMQHFNDAEKVYAQLVLENPGEKEYSQTRGFVYMRMAGFAKKRNSSDPRIEDFQKRSVELGYEEPYFLKASRVANSDPELATQYWQKAIASYQSGDKDTIRRQFGTVGKELWWTNQAATALANEFPTEAEWIWQEAIKTSYAALQDFPSHRASRFLFDGASWEFSKFLVAPSRQQDALKTVNRLVNESPSMHEVRAQVLKRLGDEETQLLALTDAIAAYPVHAGYYFFRAELRYRRGRLDDALMDLNAALELNEHFPNAYRLRGDVLSGLQHSKQAVADYSKRITMGRAANYVWVFKRRGFAYFKLGEFKEALADIEEALKREPDDLSALTWIAPDEIAACPDDDFRNGVLKLADRAVQLNDGSAASRATRIRLCIKLADRELRDESNPPSWNRSLTLELLRDEAEFLTK